MKPKLLIVDGDGETRTQMKRALVSDYDLILARDRFGAGGAFQAARPLVVLLDLGLQSTATNGPFLRPLHW